MTTFRSEETLVGLIALALIPWIGWTVRRGLREGRLPIGRAYVMRDERPAPFRVLLGFYAAAAVMALVIAADLLLKLEIRNAL